MTASPTHRSHRLDADERAHTQTLMNDLEQSAGRAMALRFVVAAAALALIWWSVRGGHIIFALTGGVLSILFFWLWRVGSGEWSQLKRDLRVGQKIITVMHITDKYTDQRDDTVYVLVLSGQAVEVERSVYDGACANTDVLVSALPFSGTILSVRAV